MVSPIRLSTLARLGIVDELDGDAPPSMGRVKSGCGGSCGGNCKDCDGGCECSGCANKRGLRQQFGKMTSAVGMPGGKRRQALSSSRAAPVHSGIAQSRQIAAMPRGRPTKSLGAQAGAPDVAFGTSKRAGNSRHAVVAQMPCGELAGRCVPPVSHHPRNRAYSIPNRRASGCPRWDGDCSRYTPSLDTIHGCDPQNGEMVISRMQVSGGSSELREILDAAWAVLLLNSDLISWIMCLVFGGNDGDCVNNVLANGPGLDQNFIIEVTTATEGTCSPCGKRNGVDGIMSAVVVPSGVCVCASSRIVQGWETTWCCGDGLDRLCIVLEVASMLFHELTHVCWHSFNDVPDDCQGSYIAGNTMKWALLQRYIDALSSECCNDFQEDGSTSEVAHDLYFNDDDTSIEPCFPGC